MSLPPEQSGPEDRNRGLRVIREHLVKRWSQIRDLWVRIPWQRWLELIQQRRFRAGLSLAVLFLVLLFLVWAVYTNWGELGQYEWTADWRFVLLAILFLGAPTSIGIIGWHRVMSHLGAMSDLRVNGRIFCYSSLPKRIPGVVWYIAGRMQLYKEVGVARRVTMLGTALETLLLIATGLLVYFASLLFPGSASSTWQLPPTIAALLLAPLVVALSPPVFNRVFGYLMRRLRYNGAISLTYGAIIELVLIYVLAWIVGGIDLYLLANAVYPVPIRLLPAVIGAWAAAGAVSFVASYLVQGMGITEATLAVLLSGFLPLPASIVISILFRILLTVFEVVWVLLLAWGLSGLRGLPFRLPSGGSSPPLPPEP
jgi:glycosyltransferase 2 family protein